MKKQMIHWLGAGLSSGAGIRELAKTRKPLTLWNRTPEKAARVLDGNPGHGVAIKSLDLTQLASSLSAGDIVVSMLPASHHPEIAALCLQHGCHLVTTSYLSEPMRALDGAAKSKDLSFINESGLDPGIDHLFAHKLVAQYTASPEFAPDATVEFLSYCGGFPRMGGEFKYKFSWSPVGVLRALTNPARYIGSGAEKKITRCWDDIAPMRILGEDFETYPNRDSIPYIAEYGFPKTWSLRTFVRGTIRLRGWATAWKDIFAAVPTATAQDLEAMSTELWRQHAYKPGEEDRVVLFVALKATSPRGASWSGSYALDEFGSGVDTAMSRLVSLPAVCAIDMISAGRAPLGVSGAPSDPKEIELWLSFLRDRGIIIRHMGLMT